MADFFPRGKKIPRDIGYSAALVIGLIQGLTVFPGVSRLGIILAVCLAYGLSEKICGKVCLSAVRACVHRIFYHRMYSYDRRFFGLAGLGRICGRRPGSGSGRLFFHQKSDKGIAEYEILRLFCLLFSHRSSGSCRKFLSCVGNHTVVIE